MKEIDITKQILALHEADIFAQMMDDIKQELKDGIPEALQQEIDLYTKKAKSTEIANNENVTHINLKNKLVSNVLAETELLAASGLSLSDWFSEPLSFGGAGFLLDIRRVIGTNTEIDLYLTPNQSDDSKMKKSLSAFLGKSINISISNDGVKLLTANLYVDESGFEAEGNGHLNTLDDQITIKGKISIEIVVE